MCISLNTFHLSLLISSQEVPHSLHGAYGGTYPQAELPPPDIGRQGPEGHAPEWLDFGDNHIGLSVLSDEVISQNIFHVASIEEGIINAVQLRVNLGVLDGLRHVLDTDHLARLLCHEVGNGTCPRV